MEALTALSVASSVIQFVDFGSKLLSKTKKLYKSADGVSGTAVDTELLIADLEKLLLGLRRKLPENRLLSREKFLPIPSENDEALDILCNRSLEIAEQLLGKLTKLRVPVKESHTTRHQFHTEAQSQELGQEQSMDGRKPEGRKPLIVQPVQVLRGRRFSAWASFRKALEELWSKKDLEELAATLRDFRGEIEFRILLTFRGALDDLAAQHSDLSHQLTHSTQLILDSFLHTREDLATQLKNQAETLLQIKERHEQPQSYVPDYQKRENITHSELGLIGSLESPKGLRCSEEESQMEPAMEWEIKNQVRLLMIEDGVLGSLSFTTLHDRRESLAMPYGTTFQWIFEEAKSSSTPCSSFLHWLRTGTGIYWINGKLGSGKSTLMRYICENAQTRTELTSWAGTTPLEVAEFYFWRSGDENQKSLEGLLRSLLFDLLQRHRRLLPAVLPDLWREWSARATAIMHNPKAPDSILTSFRACPISLTQLKRSFQVLLRELQKSHKLCIFVDGLDEHVSDEDYSEVVTIFQQCAACPSIKICTSSRPLPVFEQAFADMPSLRLQDLTRGDILHYVDSKLRSHKYMAELSRKYDADVTKIIGEVVHKAAGVFLWVKLVVKSLLRGMGDYNRISDLKRRIDYLPEDLEELYTYVLQSVDPFYQEQTSQLFQIVRAAQRYSFGRVTLLNLSWADDEDETRAETIAIRPYTDEEIRERCLVMDARLKSVCAGLLESNDNRYSSIAPDSRVSFLHRTVADWLSKPKVWNALANRTSKSAFSPNLAMLRARVLCLKSQEVSSRAPLDMSIITDALKYAKHAEDDLGRAFPKLLDQLDISASKLWRDCKGISVNGDVEQTEPADCMFNSMSSIRETDFHNVPSHGVSKQVHHWTWAINMPEVKPAGTESNFLEIALHIGVNRYAEAKLASGFVVDQDVNHHLLTKALRGPSGPWNLPDNQIRAPDVENIRHILEGGTDPNLSYDDEVTPWEDALVNAAKHFASIPEPEDDVKWRRAAEAWVTVIELLIDSGADMSLVTKRQVRLPGRPKLSVLVLVDMFPEYLAYKASSLATILETKGIDTRIESPAATPHVSGVQPERASTPRTRMSTAASVVGWVTSLLGY